MQVLQTVSFFRLCRHLRRASLDGSVDWSFGALTDYGMTELIRNT